MDLSNWVVVFDLDDTLYSEKEYVYSGINYLEKYIYKIYNHNFNGDLRKAYNDGNDFLQIACNRLNLSKETKLSLLWIYRLHNPRIKLAKGIKRSLNSLNRMKATINILTDGRSITQRLKINSLGINDIPVYISEDFRSEKPSTKRFLEIQNKYPYKKFVYIGDNPKKDFIAPLKLNWHCIGANWINERIHCDSNLKMPENCIESPLEIQRILLKINQSKK